MIQAKREMFLCLRLAVLLWLSMWVLMVPLFHVHPEADHRHGEAGHVHGGTVHTVWSPDLDCEFDTHQSDRTEQPAQDAVANLARFSHVGDGHSEFTFSLLSDSSDRKQIHPFPTQALAAADATISDSDASIGRDTQTTCVSSSIRFLHDLPSRAPPGFLI